MSFKEQFATMPAGPARENFIYSAIIAQGPPKQLVPVTVDGPGGTKITYKVMPDYISIEGVRVPLTGSTAQRVANHFGMSLPTTKMDKQIWQAADTKLKPSPMSGGATIGGKHYTGEEVVRSKINTSDTSVAFNDKINDQLKGKDPTLVAGHMKSIVQPDDPNRLGLTGWYHADGTAIQKGNISSHDTQQHSEYAAGTRLVADQITVQRRDGSTYTTTMDKLLADKDLGKAVTLSAAGPKKYDTGKKTDAPIQTPVFTDKAIPKDNVQPSAVAKVAPQQTTQPKQVNPVFKGVDDFLGQLGFASDETDAMFKYASITVPEGYELLGPSEHNSEIQPIADSFLTKNYGSEFPFTINEIEYMAKVVPQNNLIDTNKPLGWNKGVSIYKKILPTKSAGSARFQILKRLAISPSFDK